MDLPLAAELARRLLDQHRLFDWDFGFNRRKRALGLCRYTFKRIELSHHFTLHHEEPAIRDTLLHEIAHALAGPRAAHGPRWKAMCLRIGARPERCDRQAVMPTGKWKATCPACLREYSRHHRPLRNRRYMCRTCGPAGPIQFFLPSSK